MKGGGESLKEEDENMRTELNDNQNISRDGEYADFTDKFRARKRLCQLARHSISCSLKPRILFIIE